MQPLPPALAAELARRQAEISWKGVRAYRILFEDGTETTVLCKGLPSIERATEVGDDGTLVPTWWACRAPIGQALRADKVLAVTEMLVEVETTGGDEAEDA